MNKKQEARLNMFRAVEKQCDDNPPIVSSVVAFQNAVNKFKTKIADIIGTTQKADVNLTGIVTDKTVSKKTLAQKASDTAAIIYAYASEIGDNTLKAEVKISFNRLMKTRDDQLPPRCQNIHDRGAANLNNLKDYAITAATLSDLQTAIDNYSASTPKPRTSTSHRKTLNANLVALFKEADVILFDQMDKLVLALKLDHPDFVQEYQSNREVVDPPTKSKKPKTS